MSNGQADLWQKIERSLVAAGPIPVVAPIEPETPSPEDESGPRLSLAPRTVIRILDTVSVLFWAYVLTKIFVIDIDRALLKAISPGLVHWLDYRLFVYLAVAAIVIVAFRRRALLLLYIPAFPLLVLVWKLPAFFIRRKSWALFLAALQATFTALSGFRYNFLSKSGALLAAAIILAAHSRALLVSASVYIACLLCWSYLRLIRKTFSASSFLTVQRDQISKLVRSKPVRQFSSLPDGMTSTHIELYDRAQLTQIMNAVSFGILVNTGLYYWAYQLDRYRRQYSPALVFNAFAYVWLFLGTLLSFALMNEALIKLSPDEYRLGPHTPSFLAVSVYALSTLFVSNGGGISAHGTAAYSLQLAAGVTGPIFLVACTLNFLVTYRRERDERALRDLVRELKERAREQEKGFNAEWDVSVDQARKRLEDLGEGLGILWRFLIKSIPDDFVRE